MENGFYEYPNIKCLNIRVDNNLGVSRLWINCSQIRRNHNNVDFGVCKNHVYALSRLRF